MRKTYHRRLAVLLLVVVLLYRGANWIFAGKLLLLAIASVQAGFDASTVLPQAAVQAIKLPRLLVHSTTDQLTPYTQSAAIYAHNNSAQTRLQLSHLGAPHGMSHTVQPRAFTVQMDKFLATKAAGFGTRSVPLL